jgi:hypothetical protein
LKITVAELIKALQKEVKPCDRGIANIEFHIGDKPYIIKSMKGFHFSPNIKIELEAVRYVPVIEPMVFKQEHLPKVKQINKKIKKDHE